MAIRPFDERVPIVAAIGFIQAQIRARQVGRTVALDRDDPRESLAVLLQGHGLACLERCAYFSGKRGDAGHVIIFGRIEAKF